MNITVYIKITPQIINDFKDRWPCSRNIPENQGMLITYNINTGNLVDYDLQDDWWGDESIPHDRLVDAGDALSALIRMVWEVRCSDFDAIAKWHYWCTGELTDDTLMSPGLAKILRG